MNEIQDILKDGINFEHVTAFMSVTSVCLNLDAD